MPDRRREHEQPQHAGHRRRDGVGHDQERLVEGGAADHAVGHHREQQRDRQRRSPPPAPRRRRWSRTTPGRCCRSNSRSKFCRPTNSVEVPNASSMQDALVERLAGRPEEEDQDDDHLRRDQRPGQPPAPEADPLLDCHGLTALDSPRLAGRVGEGSLMTDAKRAGASALVRLLEALELLVAAPDGAVEPFLGGLLAVPDLLQSPRR